MPAKGKPTMAQAYKSATKPKDKGIIGEGKDVLKATGNSVKQQAEFVAAVGKGAVKGAKAVAGKVANVTVGDVASAPLDSAKAVVKGAGKVVSKVGSMLGGSNKSAGSMASSFKKAAGNVALDPLSYGTTVGKAAGSKAADTKANKARQATDSKYDKVGGKKTMPKGTPVNTRPKKPKKNGPQGGGKPSQSGY